MHPALLVRRRSARSAPSRSRGSASARSIVTCRFVAHEHADRAALHGGLRARDPSPASASTWWRAAASAVMCAIWQPVTNPAETPSGRPSSSRSQPSATSSTTAALGAGDDEARVLIPRRGQPVRSERRGQRPADHEAEVAAARRRDDARLGAAAISSATTCAPRAPTLRQRPAKRIAQLLDDASARMGRSSERAEELGRVVGREAAGRPSWDPQGSKVRRRIAGLPAPQEALDRRDGARSRRARRMEEPVPAHGRRRCEATRSSEPSTSPAKMMWTTCFVVERAAGGDRVDDRDRALERRRRDPDLLGDLAAERVHQRLAGVDAAAREQPDVPPSLVVPAEQDAVAPAEERRDADPRLRHHRASRVRPCASPSTSGSSRETAIYPDLGNNIACIPARARAW